MEENNQIIIYRSEDGETRIEVKFTGEIPFYNLDMIISLGYRIRSVIATHFRRWGQYRVSAFSRCLTALASKAR